MGVAPMRLSLVFVHLPANSFFLDLNWCDIGVSEQLDSSTALVTFFDCQFFSPLARD